MNKLKEKYTEVERADIMQYDFDDDYNDRVFEEGKKQSYKDFLESYFKYFEETQRMKQQDYQDYLDDLYDTDRPPVLGGSFLEDW